MDVLVHTFEDDDDDDDDDDDESFIIHHPSTQFSYFEDNLCYGHIGEKQHK